MLSHCFNCRFPALEGVFVLIGRIAVRFAFRHRHFTISILMIFFPTILHERHTIQALQRIGGIACNLMHGRPIAFVIRNLSHAIDPIFFFIIPIPVLKPAVLFIILTFASFDLRKIRFRNRSSVFVYLRRTKGCSIIVLEGNRVRVTRCSKLRIVRYRLAIHCCKSRFPAICLVPSIGEFCICIPRRNRIAFKIFRNISILHQDGFQDFVAIHEGNGIFIIVRFVSCRISHVTDHFSFIIYFRHPTIEFVYHVTFRINLGRILGLDSTNKRAIIVIC